MRVGAALDYAMDAGRLPEAAVDWWRLILASATRFMSANSSFTKPCLKAKPALRGLFYADCFKLAVGRRELDASFEIVSLYQIKVGIASQCGCAFVIDLQYEASAVDRACQTA